MLIGGGIGNEESETRAIERWASRARLLLPAGIGLLLFIALMGIIIDPVHDKRQFTSFLFIRQDLVVVILIGLQARLMIRPAVAMSRYRPDTLALRPWVIALGLLLLCWAGHYFVLQDYDLTRDEQMANFDAAIYARGRLSWPIAAPWRSMADALNQLFTLPIADRQAWVSAYLPVNAVFRALLLKLGDSSLASPIFVAAGAMALWRVALRLWPDDRGAQVAALLLYAGSSQVILMGMTAYAMSGHLALNLIWLALFLRGDMRGHGGAILVGFFATGLHQPVFHPMFVLPFLIGLMIRRRWGLAGLYAIAYLLIGMFWLAWPHLVALASGGPMQALPGMGERLDYSERAIILLHDLGPISLWLMAMNLLRFLAWQHLLLLPLMAAAIGLAWRAPLVRPLAAGIALHIVVVGLLLAFQGHGWGYRYLHGEIGSACLLGAQGWHALRDRWPDTRLWAWSNATTFLVLLPLHMLMAWWLTIPYARASAAIDRLPAAIAIIDEGAVAFSSDLVINSPDLSNRPVRLLAGALSVDQVGQLCPHGVAFIGPHDLSAIAATIPAKAGNDAHFQTLQEHCNSR